MAHMMDVLPRGVERLAAVAQNAGSVGFGVKIEEESSIGNCQATVEDVERVLEFVWNTNSKKRIAGQWEYELHGLPGMKLKALTWQGGFVSFMHSNECQNLLAHRLGL